MFHFMCKASTAPVLHRNDYQQPTSKNTVFPFLTSIWLHNLKFCWKVEYFKLTMRVMSFSLYPGDMPSSPWTIKSQREQSVPPQHSRPDRNIEAPVFIPIAPSPITVGISRSAFKSVATGCHWENPLSTLWGDGVLPFSITPLFYLPPSALTR